MKCTLSVLSTAMFTALLTTISTPAQADGTVMPNGLDNPSPTSATSDMVITPIQTSHARDASHNVAPAASPSPVIRESHDSDASNLTRLTDPITQKPIDDSYPVAVASFLSLEDAQNILLKVSPKLAANQAAIASSDYQTDALKTIDQPFVFAQASINAYTLQDDIDLSTLKNEVVNGVNNSVANTDGGIPSVPPLPNLPNFGELVGERIPDSYDFRRSGSKASAGIGVAWPVYTAGRSRALTGISDARTDEAIADGILDKNALYNTLINRYFKAQLAIIAAYLREDAYDTLQQTDHMAKRLFEEGFISRVDRLEAQSALADAKSEAVNANNDARLAMIALQRLLRTDYRIKPTTPLFVSSRALPDVSYFQDLALTHHPGLQKVAAKRAQAEQLHALSDTGLKPTVMLYGYGQIEQDPSWIAGVSASWKLWGGLDKKASLASSHAKIRQADLSEIEVSDNLLLLVEKNWHDVNNAQSRYQALQSNVDLAAEVLRLRRLGLQEGVNTTVEVVQAQTQYLKARTEQAQAANDYVQALAALMQSCGTPLAFNAYLNAADIRLPTLYQE